MKERKGESERHRVRENESIRKCLHNKYLCTSEIHLKVQLKIIKTTKGRREREHRIDSNHHWSFLVHDFLSAEAVI